MFQIYFVFCEIIFFLLSKRWKPHLYSIFLMTPLQIGDADCRNDYLLIPGGSGGTDVANLKFSRDRSAAACFLFSIPNIRWRQIYRPEIFRRDITSKYIR